MNRFVLFVCIGLAPAVFNSAALSAEPTVAKKQRLRVVVDAEGNVGITPTEATARKSEKKIVITCDRIRFSPPKKGHNSIEMIFIGSVRMVFRDSQFESKRMTLSIPDGVKAYFNINGFRKLRPNK